MLSFAKDIRPLFRDTPDEHHPRHATRTHQDVLWERSEPHEPELDRAIEVTQVEMQLTESQIEQAISDHDAKNAELRRTFIKKEVDLDEARMVEFHFRTWGKEDAASLSKSLKDRGFLVVLKHPAVFSSDPLFWNVQATIKQSIDLTLRHEFTDELVRVAAQHCGRYDGWDAHPSAISRGA